MIKLGRFISQTEINAEVVGAIILLVLFVTGFGLGVYIGLPR